MREEARHAAEGLEGKRVLVSRDDGLGVRTKGALKHPIIAGVLFNDSQVNAGFEAFPDRSPTSPGLRAAIKMSVVQGSWLKVHGAPLPGALNLEP